MKTDLDQIEGVANAARLNGSNGQVDLAEFLRECEEDNNCQGDAPILSPWGERRLRALLEWEAAVTPDVVLALVARTRAAEFHIEVCSQAAFIAKGQCLYCDREHV